MEASQPLMNVQNFATPEQFMTQIQNIQYISSGLEDLRTAPIAVVYYGIKCCDIKCVLPCSCLFHCNMDCGDNFTYNTLVMNNGELKYLYKNIGRLDCKICASSNIDRFAYVRSLNLSSYEQINGDLGTLSVEMTREANCIFCDLCSAFFDVHTRPDNRMAGIVRYKGRCADCCKGGCGCFTACCAICKNCNPCDIFFDYYYVCDILNLERMPVYTIYLRRCCISCCPTDCCETITFVIRNPLGTVDLGKIEMKRLCCTCSGLRGKNVTYTISFPVDATPELKLTIINAVYTMDMFIFY